MQKSGVKSQESALDCGTRSLGKRNEEFEKFFKGMKSVILKGANDYGASSLIKMKLEKE